MSLVNYRAILVTMLVTVLASFTFLVNDASLVSALIMIQAYLQVLPNLSLPLL